MRIVVVRRLSQILFVTLALVFAFVSTPGEGLLQLRGWPVSWFLELDPLVGLATALATGTLYAGLAWGLVTIALTLVFGRVFCGWICPFGALHQFVGWLGRRRQRRAEQMARNRPHPAQALKYYLLVWLLVAAVGDLLVHGMRQSYLEPPLMVFVGAAAVLALVFMTLRGLVRRPFRAALLLVPALALWVALGFATGPVGERTAALQIGLLDPMAFLFRSLGLAVLPLLDDGVGLPWGGLRQSSGAWLIGGLFVAALLANLWSPRFYCRFLCPLGALLGVVGRVALWRVARDPVRCTDCGLCEVDCEGACAPSGTLRQQDCVVCLNCRESCGDDAIDYGTARSPAGEDLSLGLSRRGFLSAAVAGAVTTPLLRLPAGESSFDAGPIRPPGALAEGSFLSRCLKCGQCLRACPTNVLQPAGFEHGVEGLWTPVLDNRAGRSGCQPACVACSLVCPTAAIRPLTIEEKMGQGAFAEQGPVRIGTSFVDRGRCLPWAMERPCLVCEENCPVSPKAIFLRHVWETLRDGERRVVSVSEDGVRVDGPPLPPGALGKGDHALLDARGEHLAILGNDEGSLRVATPGGLAVGEAVAIQIHLAQPYVDPDRCTGCGICEHVCPLTGQAAIRVTPENESRNPRRRMTVAG